MKVYKLLYFLVTAIVGAFYFAVITFFISIMTMLLTGHSQTSLNAAIITGLCFALLKIVNEKFFKENRKNFTLLGLICMTLFLLLSNFMPFGLSLKASPISSIFLLIVMVFCSMKAIDFTFQGTGSKVSRHFFEMILIRVLRGFGYIFFVSIVFFPFYTLFMSSIKSQSALLKNPLDYSIDLSKGFFDLFRSYIELFQNFHFGQYIWNSTLISVITVIISILFAVPGAYAVARLEFPGRKILSRSILLIYMVPAIVLVVPLYGIFSLLGLRDSMIGLLIVYPATTLPVSIYMLKGYFMNIPSELEEAGMIDGCNRLNVIIKIILPLCLPAIISVGLYVFMIAWNEFLFAFMFLDDPQIFTISRGVVSLNSSEVPRQYLMAGAVIVTLPVLILFLWFERYLIQGLTAGGVKG